MDELAKVLVMRQPDIQAAIANADQIAAKISRDSIVGMTEAKKAVGKAIADRRKAQPLLPADQIRQQIIDGKRKGLS